MTSFFVFRWGKNCSFWHFHRSAHIKRRDLLLKKKKREKVRIRCQSAQHTRHGTTSKSTHGAATNARDRLDLVGLDNKIVARPLSYRKQGSLRVFPGSCYHMSPGVALFSVLTILSTPTECSFFYFSNNFCISTFLAPSPISKPLVRPSGSLTHPRLLLLLMSAVLPLDTNK